MSYETLDYKMMYEVGKDRIAELEREIAEAREQIETESRYKLYWSEQAKQARAKLKSVTEALESIADYSGMITGEDGIEMRDIAKQALRSGDIGEETTAHKENKL